jgi:hypothetical protein
MKLLVGVGVERTADVAVEESEPDVDFVCKPSNLLLRELLATPVVTIDPLEVEILPVALEVELLVHPIEGAVESEGNKGKLTKDVLSVSKAVVGLKVDVSLDRSAVSEISVA